MRGGCLSDSHPYQAELTNAAIMLDDSGRYILDVVVDSVSVNLRLYFSWRIQHLATRTVLFDIKKLASVSS